MPWQAKAEHSNLIRGGRCALAKVVLAIAFSAVIVLMGNVAQACPKNKQATHPAIGHHKIERVVPTTAVVSALPAPMLAKLKLPCSRRCCGAGCHSHGFACSGGSCFAGNTALDVSDSTFAFPASSISVAMFDAGEASSVKPPPNFRPPCIA